MGPWRTQIPPNEISKTICCLRYPQKLQTEVGRLSQVAVPEADSVVVGGIYSVIKSKAPVTTAEYGERYTLIGPLNRASVLTICSLVMGLAHQTIGRC